MKRNCSLLFGLSLICLHLQAQKQFIEGLNIYGEIGMNHSYLTYNLDDVLNRNSLELRLGGILEKPTGKYFSLRTGMRLGFKPKTVDRSAPFQYTYIIDETMSARSHFYIEMPFNVLFNLKDFQFGTGVLGRHYLNYSNTGPDPDFLKGRYEVGINSMITYNFSERINIGVDTYFGLTNLFTEFYTDQNSFPSGYTFEAKNNFIGVTTAYKF